MQHAFHPLTASLLALAGISGATSAGAQELALIADSGTGGVVVLDLATETVVGSVSLGLTPNDQDECPGRMAVSADGTLGLATDGMSQVWLLDMASASLSSGTNPIATISQAFDVAFDVSEQRAVVAGGNFFVSVVDLAARSQVSFLDIATQASGVEVAGDGSVFVVSSNSIAIFRYLLLGDDTLAYTGEQLNAGGTPVDSYGAPGGKSVIAVNRMNNKLRSFESPLAYVDLVTTVDSTYAGAFSPDGTRFYQREATALVVWEVDPVTGDIVEPALQSVPLPFPSICETLAQIAVRADGSKVYVPVEGGIEVHDPADLSLLYTITDPALVHPIGIALPAHRAAAVAFGCGINPAGSMIHVSGGATPGGVLTLGVDNPLGTQGPGAAAFLALSPSGDLGFPCGIALPGFGMTGPGAPGELLIGLAPPLTTLAGPAWLGPGLPAPFALPVPPNPALLGLAYFAQGLLVDPLAPSGVLFGLTEGALIRFGL